MQRFGDRIVVTEAKESVPTLVSRFVEDGRQLVAAEIELYKARMADRFAGYKTAAIYFVVAGVLVLCALVALLVGLIMTLTPLIGPGFATLVVVAAVLVIAGVLGLLGKNRLGRIGISKDAA